MRRLRSVVLLGVLLPLLGVALLAQQSVYVGSSAVSGSLFFSPDNTYDIGANGATRPRTLYLGTSLNVGSNFSVSSGGTVTTAGASGINFISASRINSPSDGVLTVYNQAQTDFTRLQFGGTTSSFPSLKRNGVEVQARLADDSSYANVRGGAVFVQSLRTNTSSVVLISETAPTISSGFGTSASIASNNGTAAFTVNVGTGGVATSGVVGLPTATTGWNCFVNDLTAAAAHVAYNTRQTASTTTTATLENQTTSTGAAVAWGASDILRVSCFAY